LIVFPCTNNKKAISNNASDVFTVFAGNTVIFYMYIYSAHGTILGVYFFIAARTGCHISAG
jgi:hypothetical protein